MQDIAPKKAKNGNNTDKSSEVVAQTSDFQNFDNNIVGSLKSCGSVSFERSS